MLSQNTNALGIIFPNSYDNTVPELVTERAMASIPFAGRYRMVDFVLSSMANCGISNVSIVVRKNYHSLMDHLGTGREWDMARRHGGLNIVPPFAEKGVRIYSGRVEALGSIMNFLENQKEKYVVMSDANVALNYDFNALLAAHQASGADVTVAYQKTEIPEGRKNDNYTLTVDADGRVTELLFNDYRPGVQNLDLNIYVLERETLLKLVRDATSRGLIYFERDILAHNVNILNIHALEYTGYVAHVCDMKSYFDENLKLTDDENLERYLGLSVLGNIPNADGRKSGKYGYYKTYAAYISAVAAQTRQMLMSVSRHQSATWSLCLPCGLLPEKRIQPGGSGAFPVQFRLVYNYIRPFTPLGIRHLRAHTRPDSRLVRPVTLHHALYTQILRYRHRHGNVAPAVPARFKQYSRLKHGIRLVQTQPPMLEIHIYRRMYQRIELSQQTFIQEHPLGHISPVQSAVPVSLRPKQILYVFHQHMVRIHHFLGSRVGIIHRRAFFLQHFCQRGLAGAYTARQSHRVNRRFHIFFVFLPVFQTIADIYSLR